MEGNARPKPQFHILKIRAGPGNDRKSQGIGLGSNRLSVPSGSQSLPPVFVSVEASDVVVSFCKSRERRKRALIGMNGFEIKRHG
jgi:hypothetical protein